MEKSNSYTIRISLIVALGGFLMGFDASVISGVVKFIETEFDLTKLQLGWSVASLTLTATLAMMVSGPLSDRFGRRKVLQVAAVLFAVSALGSAVALDFLTLVIARMIGGFGVGASLILAPMYIAEIAPPSMRGRLVSFNQLNIVIGISVAFFTNYLILQLAESSSEWALSLGFQKWNWRWMLGLELLPAMLFFIGLFFVPKSPRWLVMKGQTDQALLIMSQFTETENAQKQINDAIRSIHEEKGKEKIMLTEFFKPSYRLMLLIGVVIAILQQITGINSVFFYAPMIFEQSGIGTDASFIQAILVGLINLVFTILAILFIDRLGRRPLLLVGLAGIAICMSLLAYGFGSARYELTQDALNMLPEEIDRNRLVPMIDQVYADDVSFKEALRNNLGEKNALAFESNLITAAINMNPTLILFGILGFVASFAISIGPVMWVLFSELFPIRIKGAAISFVGFLNSLVSYLVQQFFPWQLETLGSSTTFLIYGLFAALGLVFVWFIVPETKNKSLEELETILIKR
ncbi:MFS transporter, sugar porter (SP) family [Algoriphagus faecimaris]|uniref:MFS transporter, sugar porter (SP) family n=1 Tax=Algoriphagus faecimaris TaxID=686796 RepID=A0A1G6RVP2_9BACT|nr:sugar porter family MFS transporter [Algoriphagus faecimaris]SDD08005.1 MFS transporter, sugar porter (SP) family [Algoriphagus faecimaris]